jgi:branched-chain amino acid transport system ATP-binding protein
VLIEHHMRVIFNLADRTVVLAEGSGLPDGPPKAIAANEAVQATYFGKPA